MANKMLIDSSHPEETRVVVLRGNRVEEFDFESASKRQLRGNIYLAKVTRVEPSLQAAFVEYGGNRHGFLAFSEIHPDYYQIPVADRQALLADEARAHAQEDEDERGAQQRKGRRRRPDRFQRRRRPDEAVTGPADATPPNGDAFADPTATGDGTPDAEAQGVSGEHAEIGGVEPATDAGVHDHTHEAEAHGAVESTSPAGLEHQAIDHAGHGAQESLTPSHALDKPSLHEDEAPTLAPAETDHAAHETVEASNAEDEPHASDEHASAVESRDQRPPAQDDEDDEDEDSEEDDSVEQIGGDAMEEMPYRAPRMRRQYKIQEVIKRRQVLLVQVVKEERGSKGAALTTYLSLAGRYSVLMPNTARGGGISRKITDTQDRKRLKEIAGELEVPEGMGVILRTAGASRTTNEVTRDFEYLLRMWESVRELTLKSTAPCLVYEEGSLIKRSIRDLYSKEIDEVLVAGDEGFVEARDYMRMLMPSHEKNVRLWREQQSLYAKSGVETQLDSMFSNTVTLKSGGYLVINQAEALVAIDVNSGRSTREHNIEDTALRTNLEAADEVARQLRLRDLAGLIVVDFIDMEEHRNNRAVERRIKDALKNDRARIQVGRISHFGLLEMSRQRMRTGVLEGSTVPCPHCAATGQMRATASIALHTLRAIEDVLARSATHNIVVRARTEVALYILNHKRASLSDIERRFSVSVIIAADDSLSGMTYYAMERGELAAPPPDLTHRTQSIRIDSIPPQPEEEEPAETPTEADAEGDEDEGEELDGAETTDGPRGENDSRPRRKRRRRRGRGDREAVFQDANEPQPTDNGLEYVARIGGDFPTHGNGGRQAIAGAEETEGAQPDNAAFGAAESGGGLRQRGRGRRRRGEPRVWGERNNNGDQGASPAPQADEEHAVEPAQDSGAAANEAAYAAGVAPEPVAPEPVATALAVSHDPETVEAVAAVHREVPAPVPVTEAIAGETPQAVHAVEPPPAYIAPLPEAPLDPARPKRSGWWQRAKQTFGSN